MQATSSTTINSGKLIVLGAASRSKRVWQRIYERLLGDRQQQHGEHSAHRADQHALDHERPADEPVRRADELHHLDLAPAGEDRQAHRVRDQRDRGEDEQRHQTAGEDLHEAGRREDLAPCPPRVLRTSSIAASDGSRAPSAPTGARRSTIADTWSGSSGVTRYMSGSGFAPSSLAPSANASGFLRLASASPSSLETNSTDLTFAVRSSAAASCLRSPLVALVGDVDVDHDAAADLVGGAGRRLDDRDEDAEHERGQQHRQHRRQRGRRVAREAAHGLLEEEGEAHR